MELRLTGGTDIVMAAEGETATTQVWVCGTCTFINGPDDKGNVLTICDICGQKRVPEDDDWKCNKCPDIWNPKNQKV